MSRSLRVTLAMLAVFALATAAHAADAAGASTSTGAAPIQVALFNPVQIVKSDRSVSGLRLNLIYGKNENVTGLDWGLVVNVAKHVNGVQIGALNVTDTMHGLQVGIANVIHKNKLPFLPVVNWSF